MHEIMKKYSGLSFSAILFLVSGMLSVSVTLNGQESPKASPALPDNVNEIVTRSCMPCHTSTGGLMPRLKLNFTEWTSYSTEKQKEKAEKMYSELKKGAMPPKSVRENQPDIIPTAEQITIIRKWADSLETASK
jgi:hypothetical protein